MHLLRIYRFMGYPKTRKGLIWCFFLNHLFKKSLELQINWDLGIKRAHRALTQKLESELGKPPSIVMKFGSRISEKHSRRNKLSVTKLNFLWTMNSPLKCLKKSATFLKAKRSVVCRGISSLAPP